MNVSPVGASFPMSDVHLPPSRIQIVAFRSFKELGFALAIGAVIAQVVPGAAIPVLITAIGVQLIAALIFHSLDVNGYSIGLWFAAASFTFLAAHNLQTFIHEAGHALATLALYNHPRPQILMMPFAGGNTHFCKSSLTPLGKWLGPAGVTLTVAAGGPTLALLVSASALALGCALYKQYPVLSKYLITYGIADYLSHAAYAYSAIGSEWRLNHDFIHLSIFGLNPKVATIGILAIPLLILGTNYYTGNFKSV